MNKSSNDWSQLDQIDVEEEEIHHLLFQNSLDAVFISTEDGKIVKANPQAMEIVNRDLDKMRGLSITDIFSSDWERADPSLNLTNNDRIHCFNFFIQATEGRILPVEVNGWRLKKAPNSHWLWIIRDVSDHNQLHHLRNELIDMVYHDLRAPLGNVRSSLEELSSHACDENDVEFRSLINIALRSVDRLRFLTDSMLEVAQMESVQLIGSCSPISVEEIFQDVLKYLESSIRQKRLNLEIEVEENLPAINVDGNIIRRVLLNLFENAVKFSPTESKMWIGARQVEKSICLWVKDSGPGIPFEDRVRLFEKFTRLNHDPQAGLGLGLAFCRAAVEAHGGKIWVESIINHGSTFLLSLPIFYPADHDLISKHDK